MSGVFSIASHCALQYLPVVVPQEQTGCAHFSVFAVSIYSLLASAHENISDLVLPNFSGASLCAMSHFSDNTLGTRKVECCSILDIFASFFHTSSFTRSPKTSLPMRINQGEVHPSCDLPSFRRELLGSLTVLADKALAVSWPILNTYAPPSVL
jgi:hypothetical protein